MKTKNANSKGRLINLVTLVCKDNEHAQQCLEAIANYGKPDAMGYKCSSYEFGLEVGTEDTVRVVERWNRWEDLDSLLKDKVIPALPSYNQLLKRPFDFKTDTVRIELTTE